MDVLDHLCGRYLYHAYKLISNRTRWEIKIKILIEIIDPKRSPPVGHQIENQNLSNFTEIREEMNFNSLKHRFSIHFHR